MPKRVQSHSLFTSDNSCSTNFQLKLASFDTMSAAADKAAADKAAADKAAADKASKKTETKGDSDKKSATPETEL